MTQLAHNTNQSFYQLHIGSQNALFVIQIVFKAGSRVPPEQYSLNCRRKLRRPNAADIEYGAGRKMVDHHLKNAGWGRQGSLKRIDTNDNVDEIRGLIEAGLDRSGYVLHHV